MKKPLLFFSGIFGLLILLPGLIYLGLVIYYENSFPVGTWLNQVYCTGKTVEEVSQELNGLYGFDTLQIELDSGKIYIPMEAIDFSYDFYPAVKEYSGIKNPIDLFEKLKHPNKELWITPEVSYSTKKLIQCLKNEKLWKQSQDASTQTVTIQYRAGNYELLDGRSKVLNAETALTTIENEIENFQSEVDLRETAYESLEDTKETSLVRDTYSQLRRLLDKEIVFQNYQEEIILKKSQVIEFLVVDEAYLPVLDENHRLQFQEKKLEEYIKELAKATDTYCNHTFTNHNGNEITITKGNYGSKINQEEELSFLKNHLMDEKDVHRELLFEDGEKEPQVIGNTYIEVDMGEQKLFYFEKGNCLLESDVVTGNAAKKYNTPQMVCFVNNKQKNRTLRGEGYASFVNFWMPIKGNYGIHDATWRGKFGGSIYKTAGSHGCVNMPYAKMKELFDMVEIGTPVVLYY